AGRHGAGLDPRASYGDRPRRADRGGIDPGSGDVLHDPPAARLSKHMATVLIVDDEPSARATMALLLKRRGHRVSEAADVAAASKALADTAFEGGRTDLRMPAGG